MEYEIKTMHDWFFSASRRLGFSLTDVIEANVRKLVARRQQGTIKSDGSDRESRFLIEGVVE